MLRLVVTSLSAVDLALMFSPEDVCPKVSEDGSACNVLDVMWISFDDVISDGETFVVCKDLLSFKSEDKSAMSTEK